MTLENPNSNTEKTPNPEPSLEEILSFLDELVGSENYVERERKEDELGLKDLKVESKSEPGTCYEYSRRIDKNGVTRVTMDITYYNQEGIPYIGEHLADYTDSEWH